MNKAQSIGLFFASPFIALAYVIAFPFYAIWNIYWIGVEAYRTNRKKTKDA